MCVCRVQGLGVRARDEPEVPVALNAFPVANLVYIRPNQKESTQQANQQDVAISRSYGEGPWLKYTADDPFLYGRRFVVFDDLLWLLNEGTAYLGFRFQGLILRI
jgi:hypothetical protein